MKEINTLKGFEEVKKGYFISTCGKMISTQKNRLNKKGFLIHRGGIDKDGYIIFTPRKTNGKVKTCKASRLVALAYIPNTENKPIVDHINRVRNVNHINNLRWFTASENMKNKKRPKIFKNQKLINVYFDEKLIDTLYARERVEKYNIKRTSMYCVLSKNTKLKSTNKFSFKYFDECND